MVGRALLQVLLMPLPWALRRKALQRVFGFDIHPTARIGFSVVLPARLVMGERATIGHANLIRGMSLVQMDRGAGISNLNWVTGSAPDNPYFAHQPERRSEIVFREGSGITNRHFVDCTDRITFGEYSMVAGYGVQMLTHSVDLMSNRQRAKPITIGAYCLVATRSVVLGGAKLPDCSALGAGSVLRSAFSTTHRLYSGVPAAEAGSLDPAAAYFTGTDGQPGHRHPAP